jgi:glycosidase
MDLVFDFDLASGWVSGALNANADKLMGTTVTENEIFKGEQLATFLTNHDMNRVMNSMFGNVEKAKAAATIYLTAPGVPFVYYGEEIGMSGAKPDEKIRTPMQWTADEKAGFTKGSPWESINADYPQVNVASESKDPNSILSLYRKLIQARNQHEALRVGDLVKLDTGNPKVYAMLRTTPKETILVLVNLDKEAVSSYGLSLTSSALKGSYALQALVGAGPFANLKTGAEGGFDAFKPLDSLPAYSNLVLLLKPAQ